MTLNTDALISLDEGKIHLGIPASNSNFDSRIETIINTSSAVISRYTKRNLVTTSYQEVFDGRGSNKLIMHQWPILSIEGLFIDDSSQFSNETAVSANQYQVEKFIMVVFLNATFPVGTRNVKVTYTAGYGTSQEGNLPADLRWACAELLSFFYTMNSNHRSGVISQNKQGESVSYEQIIPGHIAMILEPYVRQEFPDAEVSIKSL